MKFRCLLIVVFILFVSIQLFAEDATLEARISSAMEMYKNGDYETSENILSSMRSSARSTEYYSNVVYLQALSAYKGGKYQKASELFLDFQSYFPNHPLEHRAHIFRGNCLFKLGDIFQASKSYLKAFQAPSKQEYKVAKQSLENLMKGHLSLSELKSLAAQALIKHQIYISTFYLERLRDAGQYALAIRESESLIQNFPGHPEISEIQIINKSLRDKLSGSITIGVVLPKSGDFGEYGQNVLNGIKLAINELNRKRSSDITLQIHDSKGDPLNCVQEAEKIINSHSPLCIIGPLLSEEAVALGTLGGANNLPIITPTATQSGLASISSYFFQIATSPKNATRALMLHSITENYDSSFAILCPNDNLGRMLAETAYGVLDARGMEIIAVEYYEPGQVDFSDVFGLIKEPILEEMDNYVTRAEDTDSIFYDEDGVLRDRSEWEVYFDALFIPGYIDELVNLLPQIPFNYINTRVLGTNEWIVDELDTDDLREYADGAQFVPDQFFIDKDLPKWEDFAKQYRSEYGEEPDRLAALGYDTATLICDAIENKNLTPDMLKDYFKKIETFEGVAGKISFDSNGENTKPRIYEFDYGDLIKIK
ncbi:MAG: ABC transporter substrate-binding protein [Candidatus Zixiibacteriota bacterium]